MKNLSSSIRKIQQILKRTLTTSSFRRGISTERFGLLLQAPSDHLPISAVIHRKKGGNLNFASWNLFADQHLHWVFAQVSGLEYLNKVVKRECPDENIYCEGKYNNLNFFFLELTQFLAKKKEKSDIKISAEMLRPFILVENQDSRLIKAVDPLNIQKQIQLVEKARIDIIELFIRALRLESPNKDAPECAHANEIELAIKHSLEVSYHITDDKGALRWANRFKLIQDNKKLAHRLGALDFLCLQECTKPTDMFSLFDPARYNMLSHRVNPQTNDHCVIIYNKNRFTILAPAPVLNAIDNAKPYIFAKFQEIDTGKTFVVGSIHHPGGDAGHNRLPMLQEIAIQLSDPTAPATPFYILGDYNHTKDFFSPDMPEGTNIFYPTIGTMSAADYGNANKAIDAIMTNDNPESIEVDILSELSDAVPAPPLPFQIDFVRRKPMAAASSAASAVVQDEDVVAEKPKNPTP